MKDHVVNDHKDDTRHMTSRELELELDQTRARIDERARALQERLSPGQVFERVFDRIRDSGGREFFANLGRRVNENPLPVALTGIGIAWLMISSRRDDEDVAHAGNGHGRAAEAVRRAGDKARSAGHYVAERGRELKHHVRSGTGRVQDTWQRMLEDQPLVLGLLGIAAGAAFGVALPRTEVEDEWLGEASDEMKRKAVEKGRERIESVRGSDDTIRRQ